ncbi:hypothetical protein BGX34_005125, partial [Mortierella sp. NVP85]
SAGKHFMKRSQAIDGLGAYAADHQKRLTEMQTTLPMTLALKVGCRAMCLSNVYQEAGVVNDALENVQAIRMGPHGLLDSVVQVIFDSIGSIAISAETRSVLGKTYARRQFLLMLAWGVYNSQVSVSDAPTSLHHI